MTRDIIFMRRCLQLAERGSGMVSPNPMVGAVLVLDDRIICEGWHAAWGAAHAEAAALAVMPNLTAREKKRASLYVSLEPCSHAGKTPACTDLIIRSGIGRLIYGARDTNPEVRGGGAELLRNSGVQVIGGVLEKECRELNRRFFCFHEKRRPYIILKWAQSLDGFMDKDRREGEKGQFRISSEESRMLVHRWRSEEDAVMVGTQTALNDDPRLDIREWKQGRQPLRVIVDRKLRLPGDLHVFDGSIATLVFTTLAKGSTTNPEYERIAWSDVPNAFLQHMYDRKIQSLLVEGGATTLNLFIDAGLWDEARVLIAPLALKKGLRAPVLSGQAEERSFGKDRLLLYRNE